MSDSLRNEVSPLVRDALRATSVDVDPSALVELENYSRHVGVRDLDPDRLGAVLRAIVEEAGEAAGEKLTAGILREFLWRSCPSAWSDCFGVAMGILARRGFDVGDLRRAQERYLDEAADLL